MTWPEHTVAQLTEVGVLLVEDGNHGEYRPRPEDFSAIGTAFIRAADLNGGAVQFESAERITDTAVHRIRKGIGRPLDVILSHKGTVGKVALAPATSPPFVCSPQTTFWRSRDSKQLLAGYLFGYLRSPLFQNQLASLAGSTDMAPYVSLTQQRGLKIKIPPISTQRAIAEVLGALDDKIAVNSRADRVAAELSERLYERACVQDGASLQPLWRSVDITFGEPFSGGQFCAPGIGRPLIRIRDLKTHSCQVWTTESRPAETVIVAGDVVAGMDAEFRPSYWLGAPGLLNQRCLAADSTAGGKSYALEALKAPLSRVEGSKSATTVIHLNKSDLLRETVLVPSESELRRFAEAAEPLRLRRVAIAVESRHMTDLRDTLLPHLMSGRISVREAEERVEKSL